MPPKKNTPKQQQSSRTPKKSGNRKNNPQKQKAAKVRRARGTISKSVVSSARKHMNMLAQVQALPSDFPPQRVPSLASIELTSVLAFQGEIDLKMPASGVSYAMLTRSPLMPLWLSAPPLADTLAGSTWIGFQNVISPPSLPNGVGEPMSLDDTFLANTYVARSFTTNNILPNYAPAVDDNNRMWFYAPAGGIKSGIMITCNAAIPAGAWNLVIEIVSGFDTTSTSTQNVSLGFSDSRVEGVWTKPGWWRPVSLSCTVACATDMQITGFYCGVTTNGSLLVPAAANVAPVYTPGTYWDPPAPPQEASTVAPWNDTRATAVAALFMNTTAGQYKEGRVNGIRGATNTVRPFDVNFFVSGFESTYQGTDRNNKYGGMFEKGFYAFSKPDKSSDEFRKWINNSCSFPHFRLDAFDYVDIVKFVDHSPTTESNISIILNYHIEWRNTSSLWPTARTLEVLENWRQASGALAGMPNMFENPIHVRDIVRNVKKALAWGAPIVAPYMRGAGMALARGALMSL